MKRYTGGGRLQAPMRTLALALVVLLAAATAGCLSDEGSPTTAPEDGPQTDPGDGGSDDAPTDDADAGASRPSLAPGIAWRYRTTGTWHAADELTVAVARVGERGYLMAGGSPADLVEETLWNRTWNGWHTTDLNPKGEDAPVLFDWPLEDGKTWSTPAGTVTIEKATVETAAGTFEGYRMTLDGDVNRTWTYAPEVGYLVTYEQARGETTLLGLELEAVETRGNATWHRTPASARVEAAAATIAVDGNASTVLVSGGGDPGATASASPPVDSGQGPWATTVQDEPSWAYERREPAAGEWRISSTPPPEGQASAAIAAPTWLELTTRYGSTL